MPLKIAISKIAQLEYEDAKSFYELQVPGLGKNFKKKLKNRYCAFKNILKPIH